MDFLSVAKVLFGAYRGTLLAVLLGTVWFNLVEVSEHRIAVAGAAVTVGRLEVLLVLGFATAITWTHALVRLFDKASFAKFVDIGFGTPISLTWNFDEAGLTRLVGELTPTKDWKAEHARTDSKLRKGAIEKLDTILKRDGLNEYFYARSGVKDNVAKTQTELVLTRSGGTDRDHPAVQGFGYIANERISPSSSLMALRVSPNSATNRVSLSPRLRRRRIVTLECNQFYMPFDPSKYFNVYISLECRFSLPRMRWTVQRAIMSLETPEKVKERVVIAFSTG